MQVQCHTQEADRLWRLSAGLLRQVNPICTSSRQTQCHSSNIFIYLWILHFNQEAEAGIEVPNTTSDLGVSSLPTDSGKEEPQSPKEKAPVRFGWVTGVMVGVCIESTEYNLFYCLSYIIYIMYITGFY